MHAAASITHCSGVVYMFHVMLQEHGQEPRQQAVRAFGTWKVRRDGEVPAPSTLSEIASAQLPDTLRAGADVLYSLLHRGGEALSMPCARVQHFVVHIGARVMRLCITCLWLVLYSCVACLRALIFLHARIDLPFLFFRVSILHVDIIRIL
jgi:hypothetical protein